MDNPRKKKFRVRKVVLQMIDISVTNAFLLYKRLGGTIGDRFDSERMLSDLSARKSRQAKDSHCTVAFAQNKASDLTRLMGQHYLCVIPANASKARPCKKCVVCRKNGKRRETRYVCETCPSQPALCVTECFKRFHTEHEL